MQRYRYLLFDADGTLFDFDRSEREALKRAFDQHHLPFDEKIHFLYHVINQSLWEELEQGFIDKDRLQIERFRRLLDQTGLMEDPEKINETYLAALGQCNFLMDGALQVCAELRKDHHLAIITNGLARVQYPRFYQSAIAAYFSRLFVSEEIGHQKPKREFFDRVLQNLQVKDKSQVLVIGDSLTADIEGGLRAGLDTCWYNPERRPKREDICPTYEILRLEDILTLTGGQ